MPDHGGPEGCYAPLPASLGQTPLFDALQDVVWRHGSSEAAADVEGSLTFDGLLAIAYKIAEALDEVGDGPVCIALPPGPAYLTAVWGCLLSGRMIVPMDVEAPGIRNAAVAQAVDAQWVLVARQNDVPPWPGAKTIAVPASATGAPISRVSLFDPDAPAFVLSTSGSTGVPKLIAHSQRTLAHWIVSAHDALHLGPRDRVLTLSPPATLSALAALLGYPLAGASTVFVNIKSQGVRGLLDIFARAPVTILRSTPSLVKGLARIPEMRAAWSNLRCLQCYGEHLLRQDLAALREALPPGCLIRVTYGATEANGIARYFGGTERDEGSDPARLPAGRLMRGAEARIVGPDSNDIPAGGVGELVLRSRYSAIGEWIDGNLLPGRLPADPNDPPARIYHTGDLASCSEDGEFTIYGRIDRMLKIHGQRLDLGEVEATLRCHSSVMDAVVLAVGSEAHPLLVGFLVLKDGQQHVVDKIISWTSARLPAWMMPTRLVSLERIPFTPSGKTDLQALRQTIDARTGRLRQTS